jgi:eukaryotic-like serine/threonine-protein kinase
VYDTGTFGERVFIAMEFVQGQTLRYWLQAQERDWHEVLDAFLAAGRGLAAAHEKELVHRDFKPDNVMISPNGAQVRVMDFGLARFVASVEPPLDALLADLDGTMELAPAARAPARLLDSRDKLTLTGTVLGTPAYMSPEQFRSSPADARSDQFSFCVALYEALYAQRPFAGQTLAELSENVVTGRMREPATASRVPGSVRPVLERGLSADPDRRFPSMKDLLEELARASSAGRTSFARGAATKLAGVWEAPVEGQPVPTPEKEAMRRAFLATGKPYAPVAFAAASAVLDQYARRWSELYVEVCEATHVRGEQSPEVLDLRMACLTDGLDDLKALCRIFREATGQVVENAVKAANALGMLERCQDVKLLRAVIRPPEDAGTRAAVEHLRLRLVDVRALQNVGKWAAGLDIVIPLAEEARHVGYGPMLAEVLLTVGKLQIDAGLIGDAALVLEEAFSTAVHSRHDEVATTAAILLCYQMGYLQGRFEVGELWSRYAETLLRRLGGHDLLWNYHFAARASMREQQGRLVEAVDDARSAIAAGERALGEHNVDVATAIGNLANHLAFGGDFGGALEAGQRAIAIFSDCLGPEHPRVAMFCANHAQFLCRAARFDEAEEAASRALAILERESDPNGMAVTIPLRTLGLCHLHRRRFREAAIVLERAAAIRERLGANALRLAEVHFPLAKALYEQRARRAAALELARRARREYGKAAMTPVAARDLAELDQWLGKRATPANAKPARTKVRVKAAGTRRARSP